jgi:hypothetical protein
MDSLVAASARALAAGDALGALKRIALRDDPPALALRGIAMAQLGEHQHARALLQRAARGFGARETRARARCVVAEAEVALAMRDFRGSPRALTTAAAVLEARGDRANAQQAGIVAARRLLLLGRVDEASAALARLDDAGMRPALRAVFELLTAELALRALRTGTARTALTRAQEAADRSAIPQLLAEVSAASAALVAPAARLVLAREERLVGLDEVATLLESGALVVDACRRGLRAGTVWRPLARRPVPFALLRALAEASPDAVDRQALIARLFRTRHPDESHRARLRVEIGRLRALLAGLARIEATARGFVLVTPRDQPVAVLAPPIDGEQASLVALLADGAAWSTSALALALGASQRTVQRALVELERAGRVRSIRRARARRWLAPTLSGFTTILLLPTPLPVE